MKVSIQTERLILRSPTIEDAPFIQKYFGNWEVIKHLSASTPWPYPKNGAETFLCNIILPQIIDGARNSFIITSKKNGQPIGLIDYFYRDNNTESKVFERGFWLGIPFHGKGYMTEAAIAANSWIFQHTDTKAIFATNNISNMKSRRVKEKQGFEYLGVFDIDPSSTHSKSTSEERWSLTRENWQKQ